MKGGGGQIISHGPNPFTVTLVNVTLFPSRMTGPLKFDARTYVLLLTCVCSNSIVELTLTVSGAGAVVGVIIVGVGGDGGLVQETSISPAAIIVAMEPVNIFRISSFNDDREKNGGPVRVPHSSSNPSNDLAYVPFWTPCHPSRGLSPSQGFS